MTTRAGISYLSCCESETSAPEGMNMVKIQKFKRRATILFSTQALLTVHFFLGYQAESHSGHETVLDLLNSERAFIPVEDALTNEVLLVGKNSIVHAAFEECIERPLTPGLVELPVVLGLLGGDVLEGSFFTDLPNSKKRLSDYLDLTRPFISLRQEKNDLILNKAFILSVKEK